MKAKYIIGAIIIVVFLAWGASAFLKTTVQYVSLDEAIKSHRTVQVMGKIDFAAVSYNSIRRGLSSPCSMPKRKTPWPLHECR